MLPVKLAQTMEPLCVASAVVMMTGEAVWKYLKGPWFLNPLCLDNTGMVRYASASTLPMAQLWMNACKFSLKYMWNLGYNAIYAVANLC